MEEEEDFGACARRLQAHFLNVHQLRISLSQAYEAVSVERGHRNWNVLSALSKASKGKQTASHTGDQSSDSPFVVLPGNVRPDAEACRQHAISLCNTTTLRNGVGREVITSITNWFNARTSHTKISIKDIPEIEALVTFIVTRDRADIVQLVDVLVSQEESVPASRFGDFIASFWREYLDPMLSEEDRRIKVRMEQAVLGAADTSSMAVSPDAQWDDRLFQSVQKYLQLNPITPWALRNAPEGIKEFQETFRALVKRFRKDKVLILQYLIARLGLTQPEVPVLRDVAKSSEQVLLMSESTDNAMRGLTLLWSKSEIDAIRELGIQISRLLPVEPRQAALPPIRFGTERSFGPTEDDALSVIISDQQVGRSVLDMLNDSERQSLEQWMAQSSERISGNGDALMKWPGWMDWFTRRISDAGE